ncbi:trypsin-like serine protease [Thiomicrospira sp. WB1]|uniref:trypsin-like serine protease n=1 Tax=Thiomicrospira sp. WB1 TaxID=1685380 RepID=UPI00074767FA|nr:trypsin-like serine protease [Thiomicrospira sp. WB1]KUJ72444.1 hypothetical protein AVO41_01115 [Thiomicrospira sp. WB1]
MVATTKTFNNDLYDANNYPFTTGVVEISTDTGYRGTGALLYDGRSILTAAHIFGNSTEVSVTFEQSNGTRTQRDASKITKHPNYDFINDNQDLAIVHLTEQAPAFAKRYDLYRQDDAIGKIFTFSGYGTPGTGIDGTSTNVFFDKKLIAQNRFDTDAGVLKNELGELLAWRPQPDSILVADFDNGQRSQDALGQFLGIDDLGVGQFEGLMTPGDSGGPAFINGQIAGIASYTSSLESYQSAPDVDVYDNSSFGEQGYWQKTAYSEHQSWIDQTIRQHYQKPPQTPEKIETNINEPAWGETIINYFLVEFHGVRNDEHWISVDYQTIDGTARAGEDYLPVQGRLVLYPDTDFAVIPIEILGDSIIENPETFSLEISNPVGGEFAGGSDTLSASRTIYDYDTLIA